MTRLALGRWCGGAATSEFCAPCAIEDISCWSAKLPNPQLALCSMRRRETHEPLSVLYISGNSGLTAVIGIRSTLTGHGKVPATHGHPALPARPGCFRRVAAGLRSETPHSRFVRQPRSVD